jgi:hypothetical protein
MSLIRIEAISPLMMLTTSVKSCNAYPLSTALIRTACSRMLSAFGCIRKSLTANRASCFECGATESSRSYATKSTLSERDLFSIFWEEPGTAFLVNLWFIICSGNFAYHRAMLFSRRRLPSSFFSISWTRPLKSYVHYFLFECYSTTEVVVSRVSSIDFGPYPSISRLRTSGYPIRQPMLSKAQLYR